MDTLDTRQFKDIFLMEVEDHIQKLNDNVLALERIGTAPEKSVEKNKLLNEMMRSSHTIKGSSASMGYVRLAYLTHVLEDIFDGARRGELQIDKPIFDKIFYAVDEIEKSISNIKTSDTESDTDGLAAELKSLAGVTTTGIGKSVHKQEPEIATAEPVVSAVAADEAVQINYIKVPVSRLEQLMGLVEELHINKMNLEALAQKHKEIKDVSRQISLLVAGIQFQVTQARMVPLEQVFARFPRMVRDLARSQGKTIIFEVIGNKIELDRTIIDKIGEPLIHLLRNAVDHGITKEGKIVLRAVREGDRVMFSVENDGHSIDFDRVREAAVRKGIIGAAEAKDFNEERVKELLFRSGLSTREVVTDISGRGVGLSVVKRFVDALNGRLLIDNQPAGVRFTMVLPLTLAIVNVLLVLIEGNKYAIPFVNIERLTKAGADNIRQFADRDIATIGNDYVSLIRFDELLNKKEAVPLGALIQKDQPIANARLKPKKASSADSKQKHMVVVIIKNEKYSLGLIVDKLIDIQEVIVKPLSPLLQGIKCFSGSTILGDGQVVPILDVDTLVPVA